MMRSQPSILEITVVSAEGIKNASSGAFFSSPPRPFITITPAAAYPPPPPCKPDDGGGSCHVYRTRVDDVGGVNPTWGDKFQIPLDPTFFTAGPTAGLYLHVFTKRALLVRGPAQLGWCHIPLSDIVDRPSTVGQIRNLSYRVRAKDGSRGEGVVNIVVRLMGSVPDPGRPEMGLTFGRINSNPSHSNTAIGIPITMCPTTSYDRPPYI